MLTPALLEALSIAELPEVQWKHGDDLCDCVFQRIGMWKNPYLATTQEIRLCCVWAELGKMFPDFVRTIPGYFNENTQRWDTNPWDWNGETEMPKALWHRQLARKLGCTVAEARAMSLEPPAGQPKLEPVPFILLVGGQEVTLNLRKVRFQ